nr:zinc finger, CCHC-type [Tanacetum cinerariifolium]
MDAAAMKHMASNFAKLDMFEGVDFRRWQKKIHFLLSSMSVVYVLTTPMPVDGGDNLTVEQVRKRAKWDNDDYVCRGLILNGMSDSLFDIYKNVESSKESWDSLEAKYMAEDASSKKFIVELTLDELGSHLHIEEPLMMQNSDMPKGNNAVDPSVVNIVEHNNSSRRNDNKGKRKHHDNTKAHPKKKSKVTCWKCGKPKHLKNNCKGRKVGNKVNGSSTNGSVDGSTNSLKGQNMFNKSLQGFRAVVRLLDPKLETLGERGIECIFVGYAEHSKAFRYSLVPRPSLSIPKGTKDIGGSMVPEVVTDEVLADLPPGCKPFGYKWIFKRKLKVDGTIEKFKARLVIQGFKQKSERYYFDTYALVACISTIRLLIAMASIHNMVIHQMDVKTAFLNGDLDEEGSDKGDNKIDSHTMEPFDTFLMGDKVISTTPERENEKFIKSSVDDLVLIPRESEVTSVYDDLECSMPLDSPPSPRLDVLGGKVDIDLPFGENLDTLSTRDKKIDFNPRDIETKDLIPVPRVFDEPLGNSDSVPRTYDVTFSNTIFDFNDDYTLCHDNPLFDEEFKDISSLDPLNEGDGDPFIWFSSYAITPSCCILTKGGDVSLLLSSPLIGTPYDLEDLRAYFQSSNHAPRGVTLQPLNRPDPTVNPVRPLFWRWSDTVDHCWPPLTAIVDRWSGGGFDDSWQAMWHQSQGDTWHSNHEVRGTVAASTRSEGSIRGVGGQILVQGSGRGQYKVSIPEASRWTSDMI